MRVSRLQIENFRGIKEAELYFSGHTLLIGGNNVGKSTICEALDLVLGPDRLNRTPPVEEFDFRNAGYLKGDDDDADPRSIPTKVKRAIGFLYLRTIRTGSRALSLERGTLLDNILRLKDAQVLLNDWAALTQEVPAMYGIGKNSLHDSFQISHAT
ncbi:AAA family ATPase [Ectothiorhodospira shaposhnikovii]|uniref:AAA family ATPase n=1 Tax=Ectothiorhodospira shaposhnikovii TaxID=1054 RepID=UPI001908CCFF|nr:AAA family ATPase [Ectothiorhodospira shaposhnikovii]